MPTRDNTDKIRVYKDKKDINYLNYHKTMPKEVFSIRLDPEMIRLIKNTTKDVPVTLSELIRRSLIQYIEKGDEFTEKEKKEILDHHKKIEQYDIMKEEHHDLYIIKNSALRLIDTAKASYLITGKVNLKAIDHIIKNTVKLYKCFPLNIRKILKDDIKVLKEYSRPEKLNTHLENIGIRPRTIKKKEPEPVKGIQ